MRQRHSWQAHIRAVGADRRKPADQYPQAAAACELWARDSLKDGLVRYQSPCAKEQAYGTVVSRGADEHNEVSERVDKVLVSLPPDGLRVARAHWLGIFTEGDKAWRIPRSYWPAKIARRCFNATPEWYEDWLSVVLSSVAIELGLDGQ